MENKLQNKEIENKIEPIPRLLGVYGFLIMIIIFLLVLIFSHFIKIPMSYSGNIKSFSNSVILIKLRENPKKDFLPETGHLVEIVENISKKHHGVFICKKFSQNDSTLFLILEKPIKTLLENSEVKIISKNESLFTLVFKRFYKN